MVGYTITRFRAVGLPPQPSEADAPVGSGPSIGGVCPGRMVRGGSYYLCRAELVEKEENDEEGQTTWRMAGGTLCAFRWPAAAIDMPVVLCPLFLPRSSVILDTRTNYGEGLKVRHDEAWTWCSRTNRIASTRIGSTDTPLSNGGQVWL